MENHNAKRFCPKCGAEIEEDALFCSECGAHLMKKEDAPQDEAPKEEIVIASQSEIAEKTPVITEPLQSEVSTEAAASQSLAPQMDAHKDDSPVDELPEAKTQKEEIETVEPPAEEITQEELTSQEPSQTETSTQENAQQEVAAVEDASTPPEIEEPAALVDQKSPAPAVSPQPAQKFCLHCGATLPPDALFCLSCGTKQGGAAQPQPVATPPQAIALQMPQQPQQQIPSQPQGYPQQPFQPGYPRQGYPQQPMQQGYPQQPQMIITQAPKSMGLALILTFLFGPLGLLYANVRDGLIMICISIAVAFLTLGFGLIFVWIGSMVWAYMDVEKYNKALMSGQMPPQSF